MAGFQLIMYGRFWVFTEGSSAKLPFRRVRLYLDGLDEVASTDRRCLIVQKALSAPLAWPLQVIVTGRDHVYDGYLSDLPRLTLSEFDSKELHLFLDNWLERDPKRFSALQSELRSHSTLRELMVVPLLATLVLGVYRKLESLPESKAALYEMCVDLLCGGWDLVKNVQRETHFSSQVKVTVLKTLAGQLHARHLRHAEMQDIERALAFSLNRLTSQAEPVVEEMIQDGLLVRSGGVFLFSHLSFQEYLAAKDLADPTGRKPTSALRRFLLGDDWWKEVLGFYLASLNDPYAANEWIRTIAQGMLRSSKTAVESEVKRRWSILEQIMGSAYPKFNPAKI